MEAINRTGLTGYNYTSEYEPVVTPLYILVCVGLLNAVVFVTGLIGNSLVILVVCRVREMRSSTNYFLISLSVADSLVLLVCQPTAVLELYAEDRWLLGRSMCKLVPFLENAVAYTSVLTLLVISIERFVAVCHPLAVHTTFTKTRTAQATIIVWVVAFALSTPFVVRTDIEEATLYDGSLVSVCKTRIHETWHHVYILFTITGLFVLPLFIFCVLYMFILANLRRDALDVGRRNEKRDRQQLIALLISVIVLFFVSLLPVRVITVWKIYTATANIVALGLEGYLCLMWFARIMMYISSAGNPIIYNMVSTKFRKALKRAFQTPTKRRNLVYRGRISSSKGTPFTQVSTESENSRPRPGSVRSNLRE